MKLFLVNPETGLIGKLSRNMYKEFHPNDKAIFEKNIKNILGLKLLYSDYVDDNGKVLADTIALGQDNMLYLIGYKKNKKDNIFERYEKQYNNLKNQQEIFHQNVRHESKNDLVSIYNMKLLIIGSSFNKQEKEKANQTVIPCELFRWTLINNILIFENINKKNVLT